MKTQAYPLEIKALDDAGTFEGYGAVFGNTDQGGDKIAPGAFVESLAKHRREGTTVKMLWAHDPSEPIGVWDDLAEDAKGLWGKGRLVLDVSRAREVHALMKAKAVGGLSIGYQTVESIPEGNARVLKRVSLWEVSPVTFPMNGRARIEAVKGAEALSDFARRLRDGEPPEIKEFEDLLREAGVPKALAVRIASHGYAKAIRSESEGKASETALGALRDAARVLTNRT